MWTDTMVSQCACALHRPHRSLRQGERSAWHVVVSALVLLCVLTAPVLPQDTAAPGGLLTLTPYETHTFRDPLNSKYFHYFLLDPASNSLFVGALEHVYKLNLTNVEKFIRSDKIEATRAEESLCQARGYDSEFVCRNHIRAISLEDARITVCGTSAYAPREFYLNLGTLQLEGAEASRSGIAKCPYDPTDEATSIYVRSGNPDGLPSIYAATVTDVRKQDPVIYRPALRANNLEMHKLVRNVQNLKWLNEPHFVGSFDVGEYVYFFFREKAVEYSNCDENRVFSRVARVCKSDRGGTTSPLANKWTSFYKARLSCSSSAAPGERFTYDHLRDVTRLADGNFAAVFNTGSSGLTGSALCVFALADIEAAFAGSWKEQVNTSSIWTTVLDSNVPTPRPGVCSSDVHQSHIYQWIVSHPIMATTVLPHHDAPLFSRPDIMYRHLVAVDDGTSLDGNSGDPVTVYFLATAHSMHKVAVLPGVAGSSPPATRLLAQWDLGAEEEIRRVTYHAGSLYVGTDRAVRQYSLGAQCRLYQTCTRCAHDPHCGWNPQGHSCVAYAAGPGYTRSSLIQAVRSESPNYKCNTHCRWQGELNKVHVRVPGDPVRLHCQARCEATEPIQWTRVYNEQTSIYDSMELVTIDNTQYFLSAHDNSLIVFNVTRSAMFQCRSGGIVFMEHQVDVPRCDGDSAGADALECLWEAEFRSWCQAFDAYKREFNEWRCLKSKCLDDESCMPSQISGQCSAESP